MISASMAKRLATTAKVTKIKDVKNRYSVAFNDEGAIEVDAKTETEARNKAAEWLQSDESVERLVEQWRLGDK